MNGKIPRLRNESSEVLRRASSRRRSQLCSRRRRLRSYKTLVYGPVQDSALDQIWFLAMRIRKALDFDVEEYYLRCSEDEVEEAWDRYQKLTRNNNKRMLRGTAR
ncbi:hypothetical protein BSP15_007 [Bacillus phage BSP15]|nr:hypothetical protein BSP15_007 [Bacillus phage BSP15]